MSMLWIIDLWQKHITHATQSRLHCSVVYALTTQSYIHHLVYISLYVTIPNLPCPESVGHLTYDRGHSGRCCTRRESRSGCAGVVWHRRAAPTTSHRTHAQIYIPYTSVCISYTLQLSPNRKAVGQQWILLGNHCCREPPYWSQSALQHHDEGMYTNTTEVVERNRDWICVKGEEGRGCSCISPSSIFILSLRHWLSIRN